MVGPQLITNRKLIYPISIYEQLRVGVCPVASGSLVEVYAVARGSLVEVYAVARGSLVEVLEKNARKFSGSFAARGLPKSAESAEIVKEVACRNRQNLPNSTAP